MEITNLCNEAISDASLEICFGGKTSMNYIISLKIKVFFSVSDSHWFQCGSGYRSGYRSRVLMTKNWKKLPTDEKN
jgi:hypothetical protein